MAHHLMDNEPMTLVELAVSCRDLANRDLASKSDPMCVLMMRETMNEKWYEEGRSERILDTLNPDFAHRFRLNYCFEKRQKLSFEIYDVDSESADLDKHDALGTAEVSLGAIVGAPGNKLTQPLMKHGKHSGSSIIVSAEEVGSNKEVAVMQFQGSKLDKKDFMGKSDPFYIIYRVDDDQTRSVIARSEVIKHNLNPLWKPFKISVQTMTHGNPNRELVIEVFDHDRDGGHDLIGVCHTSFAQLNTANKGQQFELINQKKKERKSHYKNSGTIELNKFSTHTEYSFLDYIRGGTQIHFTVAVDFTASNGNPTQPESLHFIHPHQPNQYMLALKAVGDICADYDIDKMFPALGFGAKLPSGEVSHEFYMNFHPTDPHCRGVDGILAAYRQSLLTVQLYGPTNFSPIINHVLKFAAAAAAHGTHYFVLLILTDGVITDFDATVQAIVRASTLPMSIIIVGVGNDDFEAMEALDSDKQRLVDNKGNAAERDIVQFVPFRDYMSQTGNVRETQARLAKDVLREIPNQLTSYMNVRKIVPRPPAVHPTPPPAMNQAPPPINPNFPPQPGMMNPGMPNQPNALYPSTGGTTPNSPPYPPQ